MKHRLLSLILALSLLFSIPVGAAYTPEEQYDLLLELQELIRTEGLESATYDLPLKKALTQALADDPTLFERLMTEMLSDYDKHTMFLPAGSYSQSFGDEEDYVGIGVTVQAHPKGALVTDVNLTGPAFAAGIRRGDVLTQSDDQPLAGMDISAISALLRGKAGTSVTVQLLREGQTLTFTLTRKLLLQRNYSGGHMADGVYYMKWTRIEDDGSYLLFRQGLRDMQQLGDTCLILDLRDNPGGSLDLAFTIASDLIPEAVPFFKTVTRDPKGGNEKVTYPVTALGDGVAVPHIFVLTNGGTASSAEIITAALCDAAGAVSIGETTYGKARAQQHLLLEDDSAIVLTTMELHGLTAGDYEGVGLKPQIAVTNSLSKGEDLFRVPETVALAPYSCSDNGEALNRALVSLGLMEQLPAKPYQVGEPTLAVCRLLEALYLTPRTDDAPIGIDALRLVNYLLDAQGQGLYLRDDQLAKALELAEAAQK